MVIIVTQITNAPVIDKRLQSLSVELLAVPHTIDHTSSDSPKKPLRYASDLSTVIYGRCLVLDMRGAMQFRKAEPRWYALSFNLFFFSDEKNKIRKTNLFKQASIITELASLILACFSVLSSPLPDT